MKRLILMVLLFSGVALLAPAHGQTRQQQKTTTRTVNKQTKVKKSDSVAKANVRKKAISKVSNRKILHWTNGQRSTKTGEVATASNGNSYAAVKKDTAHIVQKPKGRQKNR